MKATNTSEHNGTNAEDGEIDDAKVVNKAMPASQSVSAVTNANLLRPDSARGGRTRTPDVQSTSGSKLPQSQLKPDVPAFTPAAIAPSHASKPELHRSTSSTNLPPIRPPHNLPARPDGPIPGRERLSHRPEPTRPESRSGETYGRLDRPTDVPRAVDALPKDLFRDRSPGHRSRGRTPEGHRDRRDPGHGPSDRPRDPRDIRDPRDVRDPREPRELRDPVGPRDPRDLRDSREYTDPRESRGRGGPSFPRDLRDEREREWETSRARVRGGPESRGPTTPFDPRERDRQHPPQPTTVRGPDVASPREPVPGTGPAINPERAALMSASAGPAGPALNPERAQLINQDDRRQSDRAATLKSKLEQERQTRDQRNARPPSPRGDERSSTGGGRGSSHRDERDAAPQRPAPISENKDRRDESGGPPPSAPRVDRLVQEGQGQGRGRDLFNQPTPPARVSAESSHGRLSQANQDPNYGRLNASNDTPLGPRGGGRGNGAPRGGGGRNFTAPAPSGPRSMDSTASPTIPLSPNHDRAPPTGPAAAPPASAPHGPAADQASIHPSRLRHIQPPNLQMNNIPTGPNGQGNTATSPFTPQGPRGGRPTPSSGNMAAPSPTSRFPPTPSGPGMGQRGNRLMQNITGTLRQANEETGPMIRGRASTGRLGNSQQQSAPQSPVISQSTANPSSKPDGQSPYIDLKGRSDLMADRMSKVAAEGNDAPSPAGSGGHDDRSDSKGGRQRSGKHESDRGSRRHRSRSRSPRRDASDKPPRARDEPTRSGTDDRRDRDKTGSDRDRGRELHSSSGRRRGGHNDHDREPRESRGGGDRDGRHSERRSDRPRDEPRGPLRTDEPPPRRGIAIWDGKGPRPPTPPPPPPLPQNGDSRGGRGGERKDERDRRDDGGRDRKRGRGGGEGEGPDSKRRRGP